jgi:hypothetical protein
MRHSSSDKSVRAATVVGSWAGMPGVIPHNEISAIFSEKSKGPKGKEAQPHTEEPDTIIIE